MSNNLFQFLLTKKKKKSSFLKISKFKQNDQDLNEQPDRHYVSFVIVL